MRKAAPTSQASLLRKSILQAAVQGKLVPQNANDEPASVLLERIKAEQTKLVKEGKLKKEKPLPPIAEEEKSFDLPNGWEWVRLCEIFNFIDYRGKTPTKLTQGVPLITAANIKKGYMDYKKKWFISDTEYGQRQSRGIAVKGDILFTTEAPLGNVALADLDCFSTGQRIITLQGMKNGLCNALYVFFLLSPDIVEQVLGKRSGVTATGIKSALLKTVLVPLPPLAEQERIVAKVNELMHQCDQLEQAEQAALALDAHFFDTLPKSILQAAVQGKLVPQDEGDESASVLLERIKAEKAKLIKDGKLKKEKPLPPITEDEKPFDLPQGWEWVRLGNVVSINPKNKLDDDTNVAFLPMALISQDYLGGHQQEIRTWGQVKKGFTHFAEGDVLLAKITPCFENGKSCIAKNLKSGFGAGTTELHVLRCIEIFSPYLLMFLKNPMFLQDAAENMTGTAGQQRVPTEYLRNYVFALPPMEEQNRIVDFVVNFFCKFKNN